jgi:hypothetical protein
MHAPLNVPMCTHLLDSPGPRDYQVATRGLGRCCRAAAGCSTVACLSVWHGLSRAVAQRDVTANPTVAAFYLRPSRLEPVHPGLERPVCDPRRSVAHGRLPSLTLESRRTLAPMRPAAACSWRNRTGRSTSPRAEAQHPSGRPWSGGTRRRRRPPRRRGRTRSRRR